MLRYTEGFYKASLDEDSKRYGLKPTSVTELAQPLDYSDELDPPRKLKTDRDGLETPHLKLATHTRKEWASTADGQRFRYEHIILDITNRTDKPIAYRVQTEISHPEKCRTKGSIPHNALVLAPHQTVERTECLWRPGETITIKSVEVIELTELGSFYVSRLEPNQVLVDERTSMAHTRPKGAGPCKLPAPWRDIQTGAHAGDTTWADVIDFYARHNCDEYSFYRGYHRWKTPGTLPAHQ
jgi:hypothetical protein